MPARSLRSVSWMTPEEAQVALPKSSSVARLYFWLRLQRASCRIGFSAKEDFSACLSFGSAVASWCGGDRLPCAHSVRGCLGNGTPQCLHGLDEGSSREGVRARQDTHGLAPQVAEIRRGRGRLVRLFRNG